LKSAGNYYWTLNLTNTQPARFRIYELAGNKNAPTYIDNLTFYYTGEEGAPSEFAKGDVNGDREVNIADVNAAIKIILGETAAADVLRRADVNEDTEINIADVNAIIKLILN
jgi:hypothetical protein